MKFSLKAVDSSAQVVALELDASDETAARDVARQQGYSVLTLTRRHALPFVDRLGRQAFPTTLFSIQLLALLDAGLNIVEALQTLAENEPRGEQRRLLEQLLQSLHRGESLSDAAARLPQAFPQLYVATIRSSERTGNMKDALRRYIAYREELDKVRKKTVAALLYPAILLAVGTMVLAFLIFYVVPRFARVYEDISTPLPFFSSMLLSLGGWVDRHAISVLVMFVATTLGAAYLLSREAWRATAIDTLWRIPALGARLKIYGLARLYRSMAMLLRAGIPAVKALEMVKGLLAANLRDPLQRAIGLVRDGNSMSGTLTGVGLATPVATRLMLVGEQTGQMAELMDRIAQFYDEETARFVDAFTRLLEPLLMSALGLAVGLVVVLMYMPIFELAGAIQ